MEAELTDEYCGICGTDDLPRTPVLVSIGFGGIQAEAHGKPNADVCSFCLGLLDPVEGKDGVYHYPSPENMMVRLATSIRLMLKKGGA